MTELAVEFVLQQPGFALTNAGPFVLPMTTNVGELNKLVNELIAKQDDDRQEGDSSLSWAFRIDGIRILNDILSIASQQPKFSTEETVKIEVYLPLRALECQDAGDTPDAIISICLASQSATATERDLVCLGSRANVTLKAPDDLSESKAIIRSDEPNSVALLQVGSSKFYLLVTACGAVQLVDVEARTNVVYGKIQVASRISAATLTAELDMIAIGDGEGSVALYKLPAAIMELDGREVATSTDGQTVLESRKRNLTNDYKWVLSSPVLKKSMFQMPVSWIRFHQDPVNRVFSILSASLDGYLKVMDYIDGSVYNSFNTGKGITSTHLCGNHLVTGHVDGRLKLWSHDTSLYQKNTSASLKCLQISKTHSKAITDVCICHRDQRIFIVSASNDKTVCFTDIKSSSAEVSVVVGESAPGKVGDYGLYPTALLVDGDSIFIGTNNSRVYRYSLL